MTSERDKVFSPSRAARRGFLFSGLAVAGLAAFAAARWFNVGAELTENDLTAPEALLAAQEGEVILVDIRRPDEWARTGVGEGAVPLDMRRPDFVLALAELTGGDTATPVALICARGVRSARLARRLAEAGFTNVLDVPEGMMGSGAGPGWLARGLPVTDVE
ncbi:rhodanese-like domain-containing protein [Marimonas sp. MJW-29]|uniref:Rhodanese-like domain-containing protein n=1 Tax=Sulfitobacter sediminis TaxID=3234186 RepID=A0ABV3RKR3_9RHOB